jgi:hypothetical protein
VSDCGTFKTIEYLGFRPDGFYNGQLLSGEMQGVVGAIPSNYVREISGGVSAGHGRGHSPGQLREGDLHDVGSGNDSDYV